MFWFLATQNIFLKGIGISSEISFIILQKKIELLKAVIDYFIN